MPGTDRQGGLAKLPCSGTAWESSASQAVVLLLLCCVMCLVLTHSAKRRCRKL
jgi:hypothetical protein